MWRGLFGNVPPGAITDDDNQHPSWQTGTDHGIANKVNSATVDGVPQGGTGSGSGGVESKGRREIVEHGDTKATAGDRGGTGDSEREAGVWVGWGGGCAF